MKHTISLLLVPALFAAVFAGCATSPPPAGQSSAAAAPSQAAQSQAPAASDGGGAAAAASYEMNVAWWGGDARHQKTLEMIDIYTGRHPEVTITSEYAAYQDYWTKMATRAAGGDMPDVYLVQLAYIGEYASKGLMLDLTDLTDSGKIDVSNFTDGALSSSSYNGKLVGITMGDTAVCLAYNKTILDKAEYPVPADQMTFSEYAEYLKGLAAILPEGTYASGLDVQYESTLENFVIQRGCYGVISEDGKSVDYTKELLTEYINYYYDLFKAGVNPPVEILMEDRGRQWADSLAGKGVLACFITNVNQGKIYQATIDDEIGLFRIIVADNAVQKHVESVVPSTWAISPASEHIDGAAQFINEMVNDWELQKIYNMDIGVPGSTVIQESLIGMMDPNDKVDKLRIREIELMQDILGTIVPTHGKLPGYAAVTDDVKKKFDEIIYGRMTVEEAVEAHFAAVPTLLA